MTQTLEKPPTFNEVTEAMPINNKRKHELATGPNPQMDSLQRPTGESKDGRLETLLDRLAVNVVDKNAEHAGNLVDELMIRSGLNAKEKEVVKRYYFQDMTYKAIGVELSLSESRTWQIGATAIKKMQKAAGVQDPDGKPKQTRAKPPKQVEIKAATTPRPEPNPAPPITEPSQSTVAPAPAPEIPRQDDSTLPTPNSKLSTSAAIERICETLCRTLKTKNADYGDSAFLSPVLCPDVPPGLAIRIRMSDKINRIVQLEQTAAQVPGESLADSYLDLAGYALLQVIQIQTNQTTNETTKRQNTRNRSSLSSVRCFVSKLSYWNLKKRRSKMLVLSRKRSESVVIGDQVRIYVVEIRGDKVRLGIEAPRNVPVHRREIYDAIKRDRGSTISINGVPTVFTDVENGDWDSSQGYPPEGEKTDAKPGQ